MEKEIKTWLEDIRQSIDEIEEFLPEKRNFFEFQKMDGGLSCLSLRF